MPPSGEHAIEHLGMKRTCRPRDNGPAVEDGDANADAAECVDDVRRGLLKRNPFATRLVDKDARLFVLGHHYVGRKLRNSNTSETDDAKIRTRTVKTE